MSRILIAGGGTAGHVVPALALADVLAAPGSSGSLLRHRAGDGEGPGPPGRLPVLAGAHPRFPAQAGAVHPAHPRLDPGGRGGRLEAAALLPAGLRGRGGRVRLGAGGGRGGRCAASRRWPWRWTRTWGGPTASSAGWWTGSACRSRGPSATGGKYVYTGGRCGPPCWPPPASRGWPASTWTPGRPVLLVFGGSLGAHTLNEATVGAFAQRPTPFQILHVTGEREYPAVAEVLSSAGRQPGLPGLRLPGRLPPGAGRGRRGGGAGRAARWPRSWPAGCRPCWCPIRWRPATTRPRTPGWWRPRARRSPSPTPSSTPSRLAAGGGDPPRSRGQPAHAGGRSAAGPAGRG